MPTTTVSSTPTRRAALCAAALAAAVPVAGRAATPWAQAALHLRHIELVDAWNRHDAAGVAAAYLGEGRRIVPHAPEGLRGAALLADVQATLTAFDDWRVQRVWADLAGELRLVALLQISGRWTQPFGAAGLDTAVPNLRRVVLPAVELIEFRDGGIAESRLVYDRASLRAQLGLQPQ